MGTSNSTRSRQELFNNKKEFSNKIHARHRKEIQEISKYTDNIKIENHDDRRLVLNAINFYHHDLNAVIFQLRQVVIRIIGDQQIVGHLQNVITELSKSVLTIQELLNSEIEELKIKLKGILTEINSQDVKLLQIIECDNLHEYKEKVLDIQLDLVTYTDALKLYIQQCTLSLAEVEGNTHEIIEKVKNNLHQIKCGHEVNTDDFVHYMRHSVHHLQKHTDDLRKLNNNEDFPNDVRDTLIKRAESLGSELVGNILESLDSENPMENLLDVIDYCDKAVGKACVEFQTIFQSEVLESCFEASASQY